MKRVFVALAAVCVLLPLTSITRSETGKAGRLPRTHGAWVYDTFHRPGEPRRHHAGHFAAELNRYNGQAVREHRLGVVYIFGGTMEMYCPERNPARCRPQHLRLTLPGPGEADSERGRQHLHSIDAYRERVATEAGAPVSIVVLIDGRVDGEYEGSLLGFNELSRDNAETFADKVARRVCANPSLAGVQVDVEPFAIDSRNGQYHFYRRLAHNLVEGVPAQGGEPAVACRSEAHPHGRYFSIFASVRHLRPGTPSAEHLRTIVHERGNVYLIAPLYDLNETRAYATPLATYRRHASAQVERMQRWAGELNIPYKFGLPAAASVQEFETCEGPPCRDRRDEAERAQLGYVQAALEAIEHHGVREDPLFLGNDLWAWSRGIVHSGARFEPRTPPQEVLDYLANRL